MKKIMLVAAAALFIGATAANAQNPTTDTTKNPSRSTQETEKSSDQMKKSSPTQSPEDKMNTDSRHQGQTLVRPSEIPASLRQSLQSSDYSGWESGRVYRTKNGEYLVEIKKNGMTKTHRFDASGQPIKE